MAVSVAKKRNKKIVITIGIVVGLIIASLISYFLVIVYNFLNMPLGLTIYKNIMHVEQFEYNGFEGIGTADNPFILENEYIDADYTIGIYISGIEASITIRNCTFSNQINNGINIEGVTGIVSIYNNTFLCSSGSLIIIDVTSLNIYDNYFSKSVSVYDCSNPIVTNNIFDMDKVEAFYIDNTPNASLTNNKFYNCGMWIFEDNLTIVQSWFLENNKINELPILFLTGVENSTINTGNYGQIIGVDCRNITLTGYEIENSGRAIDLIGSQNCTIKNNTIRNSTVGIGAYFGNDLNILNNSCIDCIYGIDSARAARSNIQDNSCITCEYGITVQGYSTDQSEGSTVILNLCEGGRYNGIYITSDYCQITYNIVKKNGQHGIDIIGDNNLIHHNSFIDNNPKGASQARDTGEDNLWYDSISMEGNLWSDWSERGSYAIEGSADSVDIYPMFIEGEGLLGTGEILAICISSIFGLTATIIGVYFVLKKRKENKLKE